VATTSRPPRAKRKIALIQISAQGRSILFSLTLEWQLERVVIIFGSYENEQVHCHRLSK
jgi:hypothetical protein